MYRSFCNPKLSYKLLKKGKHFEFSIKTFALVGYMHTQPTHSSHWCLIIAADISRLCWSLCWCVNKGGDTRPMLESILESYCSLK